jgi:hypothetical protein
MLVFLLVFTSVPYEAFANIASMNDTFTNEQPVKQEERKNEQNIDSKKEKEIIEDRTDYTKV